MEFRYQFGDEIKIVRIERDGDQYVVALEDKTYHVLVQSSTADTIEFIIDDQHFRAVVDADGPVRYVAFDADVFVLTKADAARSRRLHAVEEGSLTTSMPGQVVSVLVAEGESVKRGQPLVVLEAMKMEMRIAAPADGRVNHVFVSAGQIVERGQRLVELSIDV